MSWAVFVADEGTAASACLICRKPTLQYNMLDCRQVECRFVLTVYLPFVCRVLLNCLLSLSLSPLAPVLPSPRMAVWNTCLTLASQLVSWAKQVMGLAYYCPPKRSLSLFPPQRLVLNRSRFENAPLRKTNLVRQWRKAKKEKENGSRDELLLRQNCWLSPSRLCSVCVLTVMYSYSHSHFNHCIAFHF